MLRRSLWRNTKPQGLQGISEKEVMGCEARGMRFATRFTQLRLQSFGAAVAQLGRKDFSLPARFYARSS